MGVIVQIVAARDRVSASYWTTLPKQYPSKWRHHKDTWLKRRFEYLCDPSGPYNPYET